MEKRINNMTINYGELATITSQALEAYASEVDDIINSEVKDEQHIQRTLDGLLYFCFDDDILLLYRTLCRYYYDINPNVTVEYINYYREMYDNEDDK